MSRDFKTIAEHIGGVVFFDDKEFRPSMPDALLSVQWSTFVKDMESELRKEFGGKE